MSDYILSLIPEDPSYVPPAEAQSRALAAYRAIAPKASHIECRVFDQITFIDQGDNFEKVQCPACGKDVTNHWSEWMERAFELKFRDLSIVIPCCGIHTNLNDLTYVWPAGFARVVLRAQNPNLGGFLSSEDHSVLETLMGCKLRQVYAHY